VVQKSNGLAVVYSVMFRLMGENVSDKSLAYILKTAGAKRKRRAGLVVFGRDSAVELPPRLSFPFEVINTRVSRTAPTWRGRCHSQPR